MYRRSDRSGRSLEEGVLREIFEESGVRASVRCLCGVYSNVGRHLYYDGITPVPTKVMFDFICDYVDGELRTSDETSEVIWVPRDRVTDYITTYPQLLKFGKVLEFTGKIFYCSYISKPEFKVLSSRYI